MFAKVVTNVLDMKSNNVLQKNSVKKGVGFLEESEKSSQNNSCLLFFEARKIGECAQFTINN
jgi:hypothetical protein